MEFKKANLAIKTASKAKQKYYINENIFDNIDTEEKAYWLGYLYADGNVSRTNRVRLSLAEQDYEILEKFSNFIFNQNRIKKYILPKNKSGQNLVYVDVCNKHIANQLTNLGCPPNKTFILKFPEWLNNNLYNHFIRGYFDGDGCLSINICNNKSKGIKTKSIIVSQSLNANFDLLSTKEFVNKLQFIFNDLNIHSTIYKRHKNRDNNNFTLKVSGNRQIEKLMNWLYKDATIFLNRKNIKYLELKKINNEKDQTNYRVR